MKVRKHGKLMAASAGSLDSGHCERHALDERGDAL